MAILFTLHSYFRWVIVLVGLFIIVKYAIGWLQKSNFSSLDNRLSKNFPILMDIQVTIGIILLVWGGLAGAGFPRQRLEHAVTLIIATGVTHMLSRWGSASAPQRFRNRMLVVIATFILIFLGVFVLPGGAVRWAF
jgi:hypothetical protein